DGRIDFRGKPGQLDEVSPTVGNRLGDVVADDRGGPLLIECCERLGHDPLRYWIPTASLGLMLLDNQYKVRAVRCSLGSCGGPGRDSPGGPRAPEPWLGLITTR